MLSLNSDIQEFYETTLLDDSKTPEQKAEETEEAAQRWENHSPVESPPSYADFSKVWLRAHTQTSFIGGPIAWRDLQANQINLGEILK